MKHFTIILSSDSPLILCGLSAMLSDLRVQGAKLVSIDTRKAVDSIIEIRPTIAMLDLTCFSAADLSEIKKESAKTHLIGICTHILPPDFGKVCDCQLSIYDSSEKYISVIRKAIADTDKFASGRQTELTTREKEIVVGIVKGLSNKEIAAEMNVSVNTVMTHRRNIASKLHIHSAAGLTIYAIVSKLITLDEVKSSVI